MRVSELEEALAAARRRVDAAMRRLRRAAAEAEKVGGASPSRAVDALGVALTSEHAAWDALRAALGGEG